MLTLCLLLQIIPSDRIADWARAGVPELPARSRVVEVHGDPQEAIDAAQPDDILLLPAGMYDGLRLKSRITLRGEGPTKTIIKGTVIIGAGGADWWYTNRLRVDVQGTRGVESLQVSDTSKLKPGMVVQLAREHQRQVTRIVSTTPTHVTVSPAPLFDLPEGSRLAPGGRMAEYVGVEDLAIEGAGRMGIWMAGAYGCWVKNVHVRNIEYAHIQMSDALFCEITRCVVASRAGDEGAGIQLATSSFCKIEDNVIEDTQLEVHASTGNVVAYNLFRDFDLYGVLGPAISSNARPHSGYNLYEGNVAPKFQADGSHGSGSHDTVFRNRLHGTSTGTPKLWICVNLMKTTRDASIVGNLLGAPGHGPDKLAIYSFGDPDVRKTAILKGNYNYQDGAVPAAEAVDSLPPSLYLKEKPAWWGEPAWPPFGPDVAFAKNKLPAETR